MVGSFASRSLADRLARSLAEHRAVSLKELLESFEFHARTRRRVRTRVVADLCCGHGLTGMLFGLEREVEEVILIDKVRPPSFELILRALVEVAPQLRTKVRFHEVALDGAAALLPPGAAVVGVHACGRKTDGCIDAGIATGGPIAVMPCCYPKSMAGAPRVLKSALGSMISVDVHRTYRLHEAGYQVDWTAIPEAVSPMNRILVATRP